MSRSFNAKGCEYMINDFRFLVYTVYTEPVPLSANTPCLIDQWDSLQ